jgi:hypothetical protein
MPTATETTAGSTGTQTKKKRNRSKASSGSRSGQQQQSAATTGQAGQAMPAAANMLNIGEVFSLDQNGTATIYLNRRLGNVAVRNVLIQS